MGWSTLLFRGLEVSSLLLPRRSSLTKLSVLGLAHCSSMLHRNRPLTLINTLTSLSQLLRSPIFHRMVGRVHEKIQHVRHGVPPEQMGGTKLENNGTALCESVTRSHG